MTRAPENLLVVRRLLLDHLNIDDRVRDHDLEPAEVGIVGDPAHRGGYHCGSDRVLTRDYSVVESPRDKAGLTLDAAALDIGWFEVRVNGVTHNLYTFNRWIVGELERGAPDTLDIREWIYTVDGKTVRRWDRLRKRTSGDNSHLWHSHGSWFRDSIKANRDQTPLFRRYLTTIGLLEDDMPLTDADVERIATATARKTWSWDLLNGAGEDPAYRVVNRAAAAAVAAAGRDPVDEQALAAELAPHLLAQLTPERIAAAIPPALARQVADELAARLQG